MFIADGKTFQFVFTCWATARNATCLHCCCMSDVVDYRNCRITVAKKMLKPGCEEHFDRYKVGATGN